MGSPPAPCVHVSRDKKLSLIRVTRGIFMNVGAGDIVVVVLGAVERSLGVDKGVHLAAHTEDVEVVEVEELEVGHDGGCVREGVGVDEEANDLFVCANEGLEVVGIAFWGAPYGDGIDEMWIDMGVVELLHGLRWEQFVGIAE